MLTYASLVASATLTPKPPHHTSSRRIPFAACSWGILWISVTTSVTIQRLRALSYLVMFISTKHVFRLCSLVTQGQMVHRRVLRASRMYSRCFRLASHVLLGHDVWIGLLLPSLQRRHLIYVHTSLGPHRTGLQQQCLIPIHRLGPRLTCDPMDLDQEASSRVRCRHHRQAAPHRPRQRQLQHFQAHPLLRSHQRPHLRQLQYPRCPSAPDDHPGT